MYTHYVSYIYSIIHTCVCILCVYAYVYIRMYTHTHIYTRILRNVNLNYVTQKGNTPAKTSASKSALRKDSTDLMKIV